MRKTSVEFQPEKVTHVVLHKTHAQVNFTVREINAIHFIVKSKSVVILDIYFFIIIIMCNRITSNCLELDIEECCPLG